MTTMPDTVWYIIINPIYTIKIYRLSQTKNHSWPIVKHPSPLVCHRLTALYYSITLFGNIFIAFGHRLLTKIWSNPNRVISPHKSLKEIFNLYNVMYPITLYCFHSRDNKNLRVRTIHVLSFIWEIVSVVDIEFLKG